MNGKHPRFSLRHGRLRYLVGVCAASATLATGLHSVFAQDLEEVAVTDSLSTRDANAASSQALSETSADILNSTRSTDIADILKDNPLLFSAISSTYVIERDVAKVDNTESVSGSTFDLRGLGY